MIPSKIKIESFAKRYHMGTLGGKGLNLPSLVQKFRFSAFLPGVINADKFTNLIRKKCRRTKNILAFLQNLAQISNL